MIKQDISNQKFNFLTAIRRVGSANSKAGTSMWKCRCVCGTIKVLQLGSLKNGTIKSCGCQKSKLLSKSRTTHGMTGTPTFIIWGGMKDRCTNPNSKAFSRYGGRGITFCKRWEDFEVFYSDMGPRPAGKSLERIDNNAGYSPENCRWATAREQQNNKRINVRLTFNGITQTVADWAREVGLPRHVVYRRYKAGWSIQDTLGIY